MRACASAIRVEMLVLLAAGPRDVSGLAAALELELSLVSKYLGLLRRAGLVAATAERKRRVYTLAPAAGVRAAPGGAHAVVITLADGRGLALRLEVCRRVLAGAAPERPHADLTATPG